MDFRKPTFQRGFQGGPVSRDSEKAISLPQLLDVQCCCRHCVSAGWGHRLPEADLRAGSDPGAFLVSLAADRGYVGFGSDGRHG